MNAATFFGLSGAIKNWTNDNNDEVVETMRDAAVEAVERALAAAPRVVPLRGKTSVSREEEAWSGRSGRAGDGDLLQSLEVTYTFPAFVRLEWVVGAPVALVKLADGEYEYPREPDLTDLINVEETAEYTPEDGPLDRVPFEYYAKLTGRFVRLDLRADGERTVISASYSVSGKVFRSRQ